MSWLVDVIGPAIDGYRAAPDAVDAKVGKGAEVLP
jgi:hypothetical protein